MQRDGGGRDLSGQVALVIGAVRKPGIGRATARQLARAGAAVVCADRVASADHPDPDGDTTVVRAEALEQLVGEITDAGGRAVAVDLDAGDPSSVAAAVARAVDEYGRLDICCHLGGGTSPGRDRALMELAESDWHTTVAANLTSVWLVDRAAAEQMIRQGHGGAIVNLGSFASVRLGPGPPAFSAAKAGAEALTKLFARELAPHGIRVNMVHPLGVDAGDGEANPGLARAATAAGRSVEEWMRDQVPMGRFQSPEETAAVVTFLAGPAASFVSGQAVAVAGAATP